MRAKGLRWIAVMSWSAGKIFAQEPSTLPQQWFTNKSSVGTFATSAGAMVEKQLRPRGIDDPRTLRAMAKVPREKFVAKELEARAYDDRPLPIGFGQTISQPFMVAFMTQALKPKPTDRVLEIGTGSGYQAAVLGEMVAEVFTTEIVRPLAQRAAPVRNALGSKNVLVKGGGGYKRWAEHPPVGSLIFMP